jgi:hypothetical protein
MKYENETSDISAGRCTTLKKITYPKIPPKMARPTAIPTAPIVELLDDSSE